MRTGKTTAGDFDNIGRLFRNNNTNDPGWYVFPSRPDPFCEAAECLKFTELLFGGYQWQSWLQFPSILGLTGNPQWIDQIDSLCSGFKNLSPRADEGDLPHNLARIAKVF